MVWSLGGLGKTEILLRFADFQKALDLLVIGREWKDVRAMFSNLPISLDFSTFDQAIAAEENCTSNIYSDTPFDLDAYVDEHVEAEKMSFDNPF